MKIFKFHFIRILKTPNFIFMLICVLALPIYMFFNDSKEKPVKICYLNDSNMEFNLENYNNEKVEFEKKEGCQPSFHLTGTSSDVIKVEINGSVDKNYILSILEQINITNNLNTNYKPLKIEINNKKEEDNSQILNLLTFSFYLIIIIVGTQIFQSITSERINKINTMIEFKFSMIKLVWIKIIGNILGIAIIISVFLIGQKILEISGKFSIINSTFLNFENLLFVLPYSVYTILYLITFAYIASFVRTEDQIQSYSSIPVFVTIISYGVGFVINENTNYIIKGFFQNLPYTSLFLVPKISNSTNLSTILSISSLFGIILILIITKEIKRNFRKDL